VRFIESLWLHAFIAEDMIEDDAPKTVANFEKLINKGFYNGLAFHRVISNFMIQIGCPKGDGTGGPGYSIKCEINLRKHTEGALSMAHAGKGTGGSQFFITHSPHPHLDGVHTVFGQVVEGMDVGEQDQAGRRYGTGQGGLRSESVLAKYSVSFIAKGIK
jgi:peptidyl-prolyl cis-trans isomerase B (cyclophilin B)